MGPFHYERKGGKGSTSTAEVSRKRQSPFQKKEKAKHQAGKRNPKTHPEKKSPKSTGKRGGHPKNLGSQGGARGKWGGLVKKGGSLGFGAILGWS